MKKIFTDPRIYYATALIIIFLFPPINDVYGRHNHYDFVGWYFISQLGGDFKMNIPIICIELLIVSAIYFIYRKK